MESPQLGPHETASFNFSFKAGNCLLRVDITNSLFFIKSRFLQTDSGKIFGESN